MLLSALLGLGLFANGAAAPDRAEVPIHAWRPRAVLPAVAGPRGRPLVVVDPGHGGRDDGATAPDGTREKDMALAMGREIARALRDHGLRVALTRDGDRATSLADRREIARTLGAALLLSVHCDSAPNPRARGASVYTLADGASDPAAAALARRENRADARADLPSDTSDVPAILLGLARRQTGADTAAFAALLAQALAPAVGLRATFQRAASLRVLRAPDVPSVLLETGYLSNARDLALLKSPAYRRALAEGVARAAQAFFARRSARLGVFREMTP